MAAVSRAGCEGAVCEKAGPILHFTGIGRRFPHLSAFPEARPAIGWVEMHRDAGIPTLSVLLAEAALAPRALASSVGGGVDARTA